MKKPPVLMLVIVIACVMSGLTLMLYPTISNIINEAHNRSAINEYSTNLNTVDCDKIQQLKNTAEKYNEAVATEYMESDNIEQYKSILADYHNILQVDNSGIIGYIDIPDINVYLPIYRGENEDNLKKGAAHLENTSIPIGGLNTHSCISAHSGYPAQKFFDDIDELKTGSCFFIHILNTTLIYRVYDTEVVEPTDTSSLKVIENNDIVTLITCYPFGINSHRLLIHAQRVNSEIGTSDAEERIAEHQKGNSSFYAYIIIVILTVLIIIFITISVLRRDTYKIKFNVGVKLFIESLHRK